MKAAYLSTEIEVATIEVRRRDISVLARGISGWLAGIVSIVETGAISRDELTAVHRELVGVERRLERLSTEIVLDR